MKNNIQLLLAILILTVAPAYAQSDKIAGFWLTEKGDSQIQIFKNTKGTYSGKIVWLEKDVDALDDKNPDKKLSKRKILGIQILSGFTFNEKDNEWINGTIYDPENGKTYDCFMWFDNDNNTLKLKGYVLGMRFLSRQTNWKREFIIRTLTN